MTQRRIRGRTTRLAPAATIAMALAIAAAHRPGRADEAPPPEVVGSPSRLAIEPADALLSGRRASAQLIATATDPDGSARDLSRLVRWSSLDPDVAIVDDRGRVACSKLFRWYGRDFGSPEALRAFLLRHLDDGPVKAAVAAGAPPCQAFRPYSWALTHSFRE